MIKSSMSRKSGYIFQGMPYLASHSESRFITVLINTSYYFRGEIIRKEKYTWVKGNLIF